MWDLITMAIFGLVVGVIAKLIMPGRDPGGIIMTAVLGMVGSLLGNWIGRTFLHIRPEGFSRWVMAILGAILLLAIYRMIAGRRAA